MPSSTTRLPLWQGMKWQGTGSIEGNSGNLDRAMKHWMIAASGGHCKAMKNLLIAFNQGSTSRATIDSTLTAYNTSCAEMRSEARDAHIQLEME